jgi:hypothetical protein
MILSVRIPIKDALRRLRPRILGLVLNNCLATRQLTVLVYVGVVAPWNGDVCGPDVLWPAARLVVRVGLKIANPSNEPLVHRTPEDEIRSPIQQVNACWGDPHIRAGRELCRPQTGRVELTPDSHLRHVGDDIRGWNPCESGGCLIPWKTHFFYVECARQYCDNELGRPAWKPIAAVHATDI